MDIVWKDIPGYEGLYQVNQWGEVYSLYTGKILKYSFSTDGYKQYNLFKDKKRRLMMAHKAVALAFIPNPENLPMVNHNLIAIMKTLNGVVVYITTHIMGLILKGLLKIVLRHFNIMNAGN